MAKLRPKIQQHTHEVADISNLEANSVWAAQQVGVAVSPSRAAGAAAAIPGDLALVVPILGAAQAGFTWVYDVSYTGVFTMTGVPPDAGTIQLFVDGALAFPESAAIHSITGARPASLVLLAILALNPLVSHSFAAFWTYSGAGTFDAPGTFRNMTVRAFQRQN